MTCKDCQKRKVGCHSTCKEYLREKEARKKVKEKQNAEKEAREYTYDRDRNLRKDHYQSNVFRSRKR